MAVKFSCARSSHNRPLSTQIRGTQHAARSTPDAHQPRVSATPQGAFPEDDGDDDDEPVFGDDAFDEMNGW